MLKRRGTATVGFETALFTDTILLKGLKFPQALEIYLENNGVKTDVQPDQMAVSSLPGLS